MKKLLILLFSAMLLSGCGGTEVEETTTEKETTTVEETTSIASTTETFTEEDREIIKEQTYEVGNGRFTISVSQDGTNEVYLSFSHVTEDTFEAAYIFVLAAAICNTDEMDDFNPFIGVHCGDVLLSTSFSFMTDGEETKILDPVEWCSEQFSGPGYSDEIAEKVEAEFNQAIGDFFGAPVEEETEVHLYTDENISIWYTGITGSASEYKINFIVENLSDETITIQARETSINGFMVDPMCSIDIAPGKKAKDGMTIWGDDAEDNPIDEVKNIETKFRIIFDDYEKSYETENLIVMDIE